MCAVCHRDFRSLPALNGHMRSHGGFRSATHTPHNSKGGGGSSPPVMPVSVTFTAAARPPSEEEGGGVAKGWRRGKSKWLRPLVLPPSSSTGGAVLYRSLMRLNAATEEEDEGVSVAEDDGAVAVSDAVEDRRDGTVDAEEVVARGNGRGSGRAQVAVYTPPTMLCPVRAGPGLFCSLTRGRQQRAKSIQLHRPHDGVDDLVAVVTTDPEKPGGGIEPHINVGRDFQAEIPPLQDRRHAPSDSHNALLLWLPRPELESPANQQRVEALVAMARSSVVPGGGASPDHALHVLSECRGDFLSAVETLLSHPEPCSPQHTGSSRWSAAERRLLVKSLQQHQKDFSSVQKAVQTKSVCQCVEFYYLWKKRLRLSVPSSSQQKDDIITSTQSEPLQAR